MSSFFISAAHKSSGKTTVSIGLLRALQRRGLRPQAFKKGPDYIDPMWHGRASCRDCFNLDFYTMSDAEIHARYAQESQGADVVLVEGNKGLYDGLALDGSNSNAALAKALSLPVVLVINTQGVTRGVAPLLLGYQAFDDEIQIAGVILNQVGGARHESKLRSVVEHYTNIPVLGAIHKHPDLEIVERHLGLVPSNEANEAEVRIDRIADVIEASVDLDALLAVGADLPESTQVLQKAANSDIRIGLARDAAFGFYYPADLKALRDAGAELVPFDTLNDQQLPDVDALFIGGGFPETHLDALESNESMRVAIRSAIEADMPVYAECGGLMYLCREIEWDGERSTMVGALPADVQMHDKPQGRGYVRLKSSSNHPWPWLNHDKSEVIPAHEFHYSSLKNIGAGLSYAYDMQRGVGIDGQHDGLIYRNVLANYTHLCDVDRHHWAHRFVAFIKAHRLQANS